MDRDSSHAPQSARHRHWSIWVISVIAVFILAACDGTPGLEGTPALVTSTMEEPADADKTWQEAPVDGTWAYGNVGFGETYVHYSLSFRVAEVPEITSEDDGGTVTVASKFEVTREDVDPELWGQVSDYDFRFWSGNDPQRSATGEYGEAKVACEETWIDVGQTKRCVVTFTPDSPAEVENFFWTLDDVRSVSFGAWPSQRTGLGDGYIWAEVARFQTSGAATSDPFTANGPVRATYTYDFERADGYILGELTLRRFRDGVCVLAPASDRERLDGSKDEVNEHYLGLRFGEFCGNIHLPDANWDLGMVNVVIEAAVPAS